MFWVLRSFGIPISLVSRDKQERFSNISSFEINQGIYISKLHIAQFVRLATLKNCLIKKSLGVLLMRSDINIFIRKHT